MVLAELKDQPGFLDPNLKNARPPKKNKRNKPDHSGLLANLLVFVFAFCIVGVSLYIHSALLGYEMVALQNEISSIENENTRLEYAIAQAASLNRVEVEAQERLGMFKPQTENMVAMVGEPMMSAEPVIAGATTISDGQTLSKEKDHQIIATILGRLAGGFRY
ncbi:MAG: hypothetical protein GX825_10600 [Syntrophomonadaceae bacterium]|nr:hypothetical protein [Syntrophomonadaceae bacterium]